MADNIILVSEDTIYRDARIDHAARLLLLQRPKRVSTATQNLILRQTKPPPYSLFDDRFVSVYSDISIIGYSEAASNPRPLASLLWKSTRIDDPQQEDQFRRANHGVYFRLGAPQGIEILANFVEMPDLCDNPWIDWVHPGADPATQLFPFRQIAGPAKPPSIFAYQPANPRLWEAEGDFRVTEHGKAIFPFRQRTVVTPPTITRVRAVRVGVYNNITRNIGDVFDIDTKLLADSTIDYLLGPDFDMGWMLIVPSSTPIISNSPEPPNTGDVPRTVF